jgi:hypothetical protein
MIPIFVEKLTAELARKLVYRKRLWVLLVAFALQMITVPIIPSQRFGRMFPELG